MSYLVNITLTLTPNSVTITRECIVCYQQSESNTSCCKKFVCYSCFNRISDPQSQISQSCPHCRNEDWDVNEPM